MFLQQDVESIPDELIIDILTRLPAESILNCQKVCKRWQALTLTPYFSEMQLKRNPDPPVILWHCFPGNSDSIFFFLQVQGGSTVVVQQCTGLMHQLQLRCPHFFSCDHSFISSCNGLLLFQGTNSMFICNPTTQEFVTFPYPTTTIIMKVVGLYFHSLTRDYRVLCQDYTYCYTTFSSRTRGWSQLGTFPHRNISFPNAAIVQGNLHWDLHWTVKYNHGEGGLGSCSNSILRFDADRETFDTLPHPDYESCLGRNDGDHHLVEMNGKLSLCKNKNGVLDIWVLQDYAKWHWVKIYNKISLKSSMECYLITDSDYVEENSDDTVDEIILYTDFISILNEDLFFQWFMKGLFRYNLKTRVLKRIKMEGVDQREAAFITFTRSFLSLKDFQ